ncbi:hypothetical protein AB3S75_034883 [Citrus x aurantiifolia]
MQNIREKVSNAASTGKAHVDIYKAKAEEKAEKAAAMTEEEKELAHQRRKAKEAKAKMEMHQAKAIHAAEKLRAKQSHLYGPNLAAGTDDHHHLGQNELPPAATTHGHIHQPVGLTADPMIGIAIPTYPLGGTPIPPAYNKHL